MTVAVLFAVVGTVTSFFGLMLAPGTTGGQGNGMPMIPLVGWLIVFGWSCYALSAARALQVARTRWIEGGDALWPLVWALYLAAITLWLGSEIGRALFGSMIPGRYPWAPFVIFGLASGCFFAASVLVFERIVARTVRFAQTHTTR
jgi:hypothetical protein